MSVGGSLDNEPQQSSNANPQMITRSVVKDGFFIITVDVKSDGNPVLQCVATS